MSLGGEGAFGIKRNSEFKEHMRKIHLGMKSSPKHIENFRKSMCAIWQVTTPNGNILIINDIKKFCKENNLTHQCFSAINRGKQKQHRGYTAFIINKRKTNEKSAFHT